MMIDHPLKSCSLPQRGEDCSGAKHVRRFFFSPGRATLGMKAISLCPAKNFSRQEQTILTHFWSGHLRTWTFKDGNKGLYEDSLMVLDLLRVIEIMVKFMYPDVISFDKLNLSQFDWF
ncbi:hypothetical protein TNCV_4815521 [Trichonephila clavipes]|nr:hypothetical protein TNCV_4815521 [Trichonephila clavipes]